MRFREVIVISETGRPVPMSLHGERDRTDALAYIRGCGLRIRKAETRWIGQKYELVVWLEGAPERGKR